IPGEKQIQSIQAKIGSLTGSGSPSELPKKVSEAQALVTESQKVVSEVQSKSNALQKDVSDFQGTVSQIDEWIRKDQAKIAAELQLPSLDANDLSKQIFGDKVMGQVGEFEKTVRMVRGQISSGAASKEPEKVEKTVRGLGKEYHFGVKKGYPGFWLKKLSVSSLPSETSGKVNGKGQDFTS